VATGETMSREEIEAAAARAGVRITGWETWGGDESDGFPVACVGPHHRVWAVSSLSMWAVRASGTAYSRFRTLDEAFTAIAADIDEIASVRDERQSEGRLTSALQAARGLAAAASRRHGPAVKDADAQGYARCTADVVASLTDVATKCRRKGRYDGFAEGILHALHVVSVRAHVGAAGGE
jgi:hypothetical protein